MNFISYFVIIAYVCSVSVNCRSIHVDGHPHPELEAREDKNLNNDPEVSAKLSWKKLKPILRRELQRIRNVKDIQANKFHPESGSSTPSTGNQNQFNEIPDLDNNKEIYLKDAVQPTNANSINLELDNISNEESIDKSGVVEEFTDNITHDGMLQMDHILAMKNFSDILNKTGNSIFFQTLNDNSTVSSTEYDETFILSEGGHVATYKEVSTLGFELLIDSETKQNLLLAELLSSQTDLTNDFTYKEDSGFVTIEIGRSNESEIVETTADELTSIPGVANLNTDEIQTENIEFDSDDVETENIEFDSDDVETENIEFDSDDVETENIEFGSDDVETENTELSYDDVKTEDTELGSDDVETENIQLGSDVETVNTEFVADVETVSTEFGAYVETDEFSSNIETENTELGFDDETENTEFGSDVEVEKEEFGSDDVETENIEFNSGDIENENAESSSDDIEIEHNKWDAVKNDNVTEISKTDPNCPDPGWCIFWFLALDTCAKDSHCHGPLVCCMIGCSKTCVEVDSQTFSN